MDAITKALLEKAKATESENKASAAKKVEPHGEAKKIPTSSSLQNRKDVWDNKQAEKLAKVLKERAEEDKKNLSNSLKPKPKPIPKVDTQKADAKKTITTNPRMVVEHMNEPHCEANLEVPVTKNTEETNKKTVESGAKAFLYVGITFFETALAAAGYTGCVIMGVI